MTQQHPVTPPSELLQLWGDQHYGCNKGFNELLIEAAQWGADQELEACCEWIADWYGHGCNEVIGNLRTSRRPKPPSLKEQALLQLDVITKDLAMHGLGCDLSQIRRALESIPDQTSEGD